MLTSIATIAAAVSALVGLGFYINSALKAAKLKKWEDEGRSLEIQITEAGTDEERARLVKLLSDHRAK